MSQPAPLSKWELLRLYLRLVRSARRNPQAFNAAANAFTVVYRRDPELLSVVREVFEGKPGALQRLLASFASIELDSARSGGEGEFKGLAKKLTAHAELVQGLRAIPHLGILADLSPVAATRWDYVALLASGVLHLKQAHPGLGLGSRQSVGSHRPTGVELGQAWAILLNHGHLFGTFATERAILFELHRTPALERQLLDGVDPIVRVHAQRLLDGRPLYRFFEVLAAWRVSRWEAGPLRTEALHALAAYFERRGDDATRWAFGQARRLAYTRMHGMLQLGLPFRGQDYPELLARLRRYPTVGWAGDKDEPGSAAVLLKQFDAFHDDVFFASPEAARRVLDHLRAFRHWWRAHEAESFADRLQALFRTPADWPSDRGADLVHLGRLNLGTTQGTWIHEVVAWLGDPDGSVWTRCNFVVTPGHAGGELHLDLYGTTASLPPPVVHNVAAQLGRLWPTGGPTLSLSAGVWLLRALSWSLPDDLELTLAPVVVGGAAQAIVFADRNTVVQRLREVVRDLAESDPKRSAELRSALDWLKSRPSAGLWAAFLGSVYVRDPATRDEIAELDGVLACFERGGVQWTVLERKDGKAGTGQAQLSRFRGLLRAPGAPPAACDPSTWALSFLWPGPSQPLSE